MHQVHSDEIKRRSEGIWGQKAGLRERRFHCMGGKVKQDKSRLLAPLGLVIVVFVFYLLQLLTPAHLCPCDTSNLIYIQRQRDSR